MVGSGRNRNSSSPGLGGGIAGNPAALNLGVTLKAGYAVFATTPSFSVLRQNFSKSPLGLEAFMRRARVIKRRDQRLDHGNSAIEAARVAPGFQIVRFRHMPRAMLGSLI